jgi:hypothetical protein
MMKRKIRLVLLLVGGLVALLFVAGLIVNLFYGQTPLPPLPNPNGYDDLVKAGQTVSGNLDGIADRSTEELQALVDSNLEALRRLRVGLSRDCAIPTEAAIANFNLISRDLTVFRSLARLLNAEGQLAERKNRPADAAQSYIDAWRLGAKISHGGLLINRLVGIACESTGNISLVKLLPKLQCEELGPLIQQLVAWSEVLSNEERFARAQMGSFPNPIKLVSDRWSARAARNSSERRHDLAAARLRLFIVELALRKYQCDEGKVSADLQSLAPKYLQGLPPDPFTGEKLTYRPTATNWLLYSVGPNRLDDGGKPMVKSTDAKSRAPDSADDRKFPGDVFYNSPHF